MLLTSPNATPHSLRENKGGPYFWLGLISYRHLTLNALTGENIGDMK